jgi:hypothetical protein
MDEAARSYTPPEFETAEMLLKLVGQLPSFVGGDAFRGMLARVMAHIPYGARLMLNCHTLFVMVDRAASDYLSPGLLADKSVVIVDAGVLDKAEEEQLATVLPMAARAVIRARHALESARRIENVLQYFDEEGQIALRDLQAEGRLCRDAQVNLKIDVHYQQVEAAKLAEGWVADRKAFYAAREASTNQ